MSPQHIKKEAILKSRRVPDKIWYHNLKLTVSKCKKKELSFRVWNFLGSSEGEDYGVFQEIFKSGEKKIDKEI